MHFLDSKFKTRSSILNHRNSRLDPLDTRLDSRKFQELRIESCISRIETLVTVKLLLSGTVCTKSAQAPVVQKLDSAIHMINHYPVDKIIRETYCAIQWMEINLVDSAISVFCTTGTRLIVMIKQWHQKSNTIKKAIWGIPFFVCTPPPPPPTPPKKDD